MTPVLWLVTPVYGRVELTRLCFEQRARMLDELAGLGVDARQLVVGDDGNLDTAKELGFEVLRRPNVLGRKVNDGFEWACREGGADFVAFCGSDDWQLASYLVDFPAPNRVRTSNYIALVAPDGRRLIVRDEWGPLGAVPWVIPRALLEPLGFRPVRPESRMYGMDGSIADGVLSAISGDGPRPREQAELRRWRLQRRQRRGSTFERVDADPLRTVDFKGGEEQITPWGQMVPRSRDRRRLAHDTDEPFALLATRYPIDLCERMERFYAQRRGDA